jgi:5-methylcytosine-specific restriction enzyme A
MGKGWQGSNRNRRLPNDWAKTRARILQRDPICYVCHTRPSEQVDHIVRGDNHADQNLAGICAWCHSRKSSAEGNAARTRLAPRARQTETHPGDT